MLSIHMDLETVMSHLKLLIVVLSCCFSLAVNALQLSKPIEVVGKIEHVSDGDTVVVSLSDPVIYQLITSPVILDYFSLAAIKRQVSPQRVPYKPNVKKRTIKIRVAQIDAPEYRYRGRASERQAYGKESRLGLLRLAPLGSQVTLKISAVDKYGRYVADIYRENKWLNMEMVKQGLAWVYKKYRTDQRLDAAEIVAQENKVGLWQQKQPMPPWLWRRVHKPKPPVKEYSAEFLRVKDGRTVVIRRLGQEYTFLLADIYLPVNEQYKQQAKQFLTSVIKPDALLSYTINKHFKRSKTIIGYLFQGDKESSYNRQLVASGLAWVYPRYAPDGSVLYREQANAKSKSLGLWSEPNPQIPWQDQTKEERQLKLKFLNNEFKHVSSFAAMGE